MRKKANISWLFGLCICVRADCLKAKLTPDSDLSLFSGYLITLRSCLSFKRPSSGVFFWRVSSKQSYCVAAFNETIFYAWWVARSEVHKLEGLGRLWWVLIIFLIFKDINVLVALFVTATIVWRLCWWDIVFVFITKTWCKVFRQRVVKRQTLLQWFRLFTSLFSCCLKMVLQLQRLSEDREVFSIPFSSGNCFCDLSMDRSAWGSSLYYFYLSVVLVREPIRETRILS